MSRGIRHTHGTSFVAIMESHIDKYIKRHRYKGNATQDLEKALEYTKRLIEYWLLESVEE
ncbi:TPA: hypothetical protein ACQAII_000270 [Streptococcus agalactiae]